MEPKFYLYQRKNGIFYAELIIEGKRIVRSTKETTRNKAAIAAAGWLAGKIPEPQGKSLLSIADYKTLLNYTKTGDINEAQAVDIVRTLFKRGLITMQAGMASQSNRPLVDFLLEYWNYDNSPAMKDKRAHGKQVLKESCYDATRAIETKWKPYFQNRTLCEITRNDLREFGLVLKEKYAGKTVNKYLFYGCIALKWAFQEKLLSENISEKIGGFVGGGKKRDVLTEKEWIIISDYKYWLSLRGYVAFMVSSTSGLRNSEIRALKQENIGDRLIHVKHGFNRLDGMKGTKTNEERKVYLLPEIRELLFKLLAENPHEEKQFFFYNDIHADKPCDIRLFSVNIQMAMKNAGIELAGRKLDFHSLRHYFTTVWTNKIGDLRQVAKLTGHKGIEMVAHYANHTTEAEILQMGDQAANIFTFRNRA
jgi:integrase